MPINRLIYQESEMESLMSFLMSNMGLLAGSLFVFFLLQGTSGYVRTLILSVLGSGLVYFLTANSQWAVGVLIVSSSLVGFDLLRQARSGR
jgi:hypothetical protein